jgi:hypothetical protein
LDLQASSAAPKMIKSSQFIRRLSTGADIRRGSLMGDGIISSENISNFPKLTAGRSKRFSVFLHKEASNQSEETDDIKNIALPQALAPIQIAASLADSTIRIVRNQSKAAVNITRQKKGKTAAAFIESDEQRIKRETLTDIFGALNYFLTDKDKFHSVMNGAATILPVTPTITAFNLKFIDKPPHEDKYGRVFSYLLDIAFEFLTSPHDKFSSEVQQIFFSKDADLAKQHQFMSEIGLQPTAQELCEIINDNRIARFAHSDISRFLRICFEFHQWERFSLIAQVLESILPLPSATGDVLDPKIETDSSLSAEIALRVAAINLHSAIHAERKVVFGHGALDLMQTVSTADLTGKNASKFQVSAIIHAAVISILTAVSDCLEQPNIIVHKPFLLVDAAHLLWRVVEPMIRGLDSLSELDDLFGDADTMTTALAKDDTLIVILRSIHAIMCEFSDKDVEFGVLASKKLSMFLEALQHYEDAIASLQETLSRITEARLSLFQSSGPWETATSNLGFYVSPERPPDFSATENAYDVNLRKVLPCAEVDINMSLIRCIMKRDHQKAVKDQIKSKEDYLRLTNKKLFIQILKTCPDAAITNQMCGSNNVLKSVVHMVYAWDGANLSFPERHQYLKTAMSLLRAEYKIEKSLAQEMMNQIPVSSPADFRCPAPTIIRRSPTSVTIRVNHIMMENLPLIAAFYQVFCKPAGPVSVAINDTKFEGCGRNTRGIKCTEITVGGLKPNQRYIFAVAGFDIHGKIIGRGIGESSTAVTTMLPLSLSLCWGYLSEIGHKIGAYEIAEKGLEILWNHFVISVSSEESLCRLPSTGYTGVVHDPVYCLNEINIQAAPSEVITLFIKCIHMRIDRDFATNDHIPHADKCGSHNPIHAQMGRLLSTRSLLVALALAQNIANTALAVKSAMRIMQLLLSLFKHGIETPFAL